MIVVFVIMVMFMFKFVLLRRSGVLSVVELFVKVVRVRVCDIMGLF